MPVEHTPLFRPDSLRPRLKAFQVGERAQAERARLQRWVKLFATPEGLEYNESELLPDFLTDVFIDILGYTVPASGVESGRHTLSREKLVAAPGSKEPLKLQDATRDLLLSRAQLPYARFLPIGR